MEHYTVRKSILFAFKLFLKKISTQKLEWLCLKVKKQVQPENPLVNGFKIFVLSVRQLTGLIQLEKIVWTPQDIDKVCQTKKLIRLKGPSNILHTNFF